MVLTFALAGGRNSLRPWDTEHVSLDEAHTCLENFRAWRFHQWNRPHGEDVGIWGTPGIEQKSSKMLTGSRRRGKERFGGTED